MLLFFFFAAFFRHAAASWRHLMLIFFSLRFTRWWCWCFRRHLPACLMILFCRRCFHFRCWCFWLHFAFSPDFDIFDDCFASFAMRFRRFSLMLSAIDITLIFWWLPFYSAPFYFLLLPPAIMLMLRCFRFWCCFHFFFCRHFRWCYFIAFDWFLLSLSFLRFHFDYYAIFWFSPMPMMMLRLMPFSHYHLLRLLRFTLFFLASLDDWDAAFDISPITFTLPLLITLFRFRAAFSCAWCTLPLMLSFRWFLLFIFAIFAFDAADCCFLLSLAALWFH